MKNWSTKTKWIVGTLIVIAIVAIYMNWDKISAMWKKNGSIPTSRIFVTESSFGRCKKYKNSNNQTWCKFAGLEVPCDECGGMA